MPTSYKKGPTVFVLNIFLKDQENSRENTVASLMHVRDITVLPDI